MTRGVIALTGGAGFLGEHLVGRLLGAGWSVRVLDVAPPPGWLATADVDVVRADVRDAAALDAAIAGSQAVVHAAFAPPYAPAAVQHEVNVTGTGNLLDAAARHGVGRLVAISSTIVAQPERRHPLLARSPLDRLASYRASRIAAEERLDAAGDRLPVAVARPKTFVGPGRVGGFGLVFDLVRQGQVVPLAGRGDARYQLLDIRDFADGLTRLLDADATGVFHFGASRFGTVADDLASLVAHAATGARLRPVPAWLGRLVVRGVELAALPPLAEWHHCVARGADSVVDTSRARLELGWEPAWSNEASLRSAYDWYIDELDRRSVAQTTHPVPASHRALRRAAALVLR